VKTKEDESGGRLTAIQSLEEIVAHGELACCASHDADECALRLIAIARAALDRSTLPPSESSAGGGPGELATPKSSSKDTP
jgi:hypothetical protein